MKSNEVIKKNLRGQPRVFEDKVFEDTTVRINIKCTSREILEK